MSHSAFPSKSLQSGRGDKTFGGNSVVVNKGRFELRAPDNDVPMLLEPRDGLRACGSSGQRTLPSLSWNLEGGRPRAVLGRVFVPG